MNIRTWNVVLELAAMKDGMYSHSIKTVSF